MSDATFLNKRGIQRRMKCNGQTATRIESVFVTVEQLIAAVESDDPLTSIDNIGPATAETIEEWWAERYERERQMDGAEFQKTGAKTASIYNLGDWSDALDMEVEDE